jgi:hypothetical protein
VRRAFDRIAADAWYLFSVHFLPAFVRGVATKVLILIPFLSGSEGIVFKKEDLKLETVDICR